MQQGSEEKIHLPEGGVVMVAVPLCASAGMLYK